MSQRTKLIVLMRTILFLRTESAREMLLRLPGVNVQTARRIMEEVDSLAELASLSREEMRKVAGPIVGQKLFTFFQQNMGAT